MTVNNIICSLHYLLRMKEPIPDVGQERVGVAHLLVNCRNLGQAGLLGQQRRWIPATDHPEWRRT